MAVYDKVVVQDIQKRLQENGSAVITPGLTNEEVEQIEKKYKFKFPADVLFFLQVGVPLCPPLKKSGVPSELPDFYQTATDGWHNWHFLAKEEVTIGSPNDTVTKQIKWHATPQNQSHPTEYPLIPLYSHRMIPSVPSTPGNPVFSMHGCYDNIVYGQNFWDWLACDFKIDVTPSLKESTSTSYQDIPFWNDYID